MTADATPDRTREHAMRIFRKHAYARAALVGNPSDGYGGKTLAVTLGNFGAAVTLYDWHELELMLSQQDNRRFASVDDLVDDVKRHGYYGGIRLVKATIKKFVEYCRLCEHPLSRDTFSLRYETNIPRQVGLAGSSAIVVATLRALTAFYGIDVPRHLLPSLALSVENDELGIAAGLQDRVIQVYGGLVYMDFAKDRQREQNGFTYGRYESLPCTALPPLYLAYRTTESKSSGAVHSPLRLRYNNGEACVVNGMIRLAELAEQARTAVVDKDWIKLGQLIDATFEARLSMYTPDAGLVAMVKYAQAVGASANFAGSGGAIIGIYTDEAMFDQLCKKLKGLDCVVVKPRVVEDIETPRV